QAPFAKVGVRAPRWPRPRGLPPACVFDRRKRTRTHSFYLLKNWKTPDGVRHGLGLPKGWPCRARGSFPPARSLWLRYPKAPDVHAPPTSAAALLLLHLMPPAEFP